MTSFNLDDARQKLEDIVRKALRAGAEAADALWVEGASLSAAWHGGKLESLEQSEGGDVGLRVLIGKRQACVSTTDRSESAVAEMIERVVAMARAAPEDPFCGLASPEEITKSVPEIETADAYDIDAPRLIAMAREAEEAALSIKGVTKTEIASVSGGRTDIVLSASNGFSGATTRTRYGIGVVALAGEGTAMEQDSDDASCVFFSDLPSAASVGQKAGERAVRNLGARKMPSCQAPVVFDPREAGGFLGTFVGAILGPGVARGTSFLKDCLDRKVFADAITIIDDPFKPRGLRSRTFDAEGLRPQKRSVIEKGVLTTWLLDLRSARQLGLKSTGHARRGTSGAPSPSPTNFYLAPGELSPEALIKDIRQGFYVTETMGDGVNDVTGDYSLAARGFWIENGVIAFPVNEMTIAGNLKEMFLNLTAANDLVFRHGIDAPTVRIEGMTIAGL